MPTDLNDLCNENAKNPPERAQGDRNKSGSLISGRNPNGGRRNPVVERDPKPNRVCDEEIEKHFNLKRRFRKASDWILPDVSKAYSSESYEFDHFQAEAAEMKRVKDEIKENYSEEDWMVVTEEFHLASIVKALKYKLGYVVRNWTKAYEIFTSYPLILSGKLNSIHIGDEHGGTVAALNHYLHSNFTDVQWDWKAISDNPYYEGGKTHKM